MAGEGSRLTNACAGVSRGPFLSCLQLDPNESYSLVESEPEMAEMLAGMMGDWEAEMHRNLRGRKSPRAAGGPA